MIRKHILPVVALTVVALTVVPAARPAAADDKADIGDAFLAEICPRLESAARANHIPPPFFARLIWMESRFDPNALSPKGAQGIAQFMPATARIRGLDDPFEPLDAITASAEFLGDLRDEFGNLGLAAAAYNAGADRVRAWRAGRASLPDETENYVYVITGELAADWARDGFQPAILPLDPKMDFQAACRTLPARRSTHQRLAKWQPWGAHVTANFSWGKALKTYARLQREFSDILGGRRPMIISKVNYSMGNRPMHNVRIGAASRKEATKLCDRLRQAGGHCVVVKN